MVTVFSVLIPKFVCQSVRQRRTLVHEAEVHDSRISHKVQIQVAENSNSPGRALPEAERRILPLVGGK